MYNSINAAFVLRMHRTRLAKSSAKLNLRSEVTAWDAIFVIHLYEESLLLRTGALLWLCMCNQLVVPPVKLSTYGPRSFAVAGLVYLNICVILNFQ